jgi:DegV family protein with EDD domain
VKGTFVVVDSSSLLSEREIGDLPIRVVHLGVSGLPKEGTAEVSPDRPVSSAPLPLRTSAVAPGDYLEAFAAGVREGWTAALVLTVAAGVSGTYQSASAAARAAGQLLASRGLGSLELRILDSGTAVGGLALLALAAGRRAGEGLDEAAAQVERLVPRVVTYGMVADWEALRRGGRIPVGAVWAARQLGIRPCFRLTGGVVRPWRLPRSAESGLRAMRGAVRRMPGAGPLHLAVFGDDDDELGRLAASLEVLEPIELLQLRASEVVAAHTGRGVIGVSGYREP